MASAALRLSPAVRFAVTLLISVVISLLLATNLSTGGTSGIHCQNPNPNAAASPIRSAAAWDATDLPIQRSVGDGFRPIYIYSRVPFQGVDLMYAQSKQDQLVAKLLEAYRAKNATASDDGAPFFVDLAANHPLKRSNTYNLERWGWNGVCLEPNPMYWYDLASLRTCVIVAAFVGGPPEEDGKEIDVVFTRGETGGIIGEGLDNAGRKSEGKRHLVSMATVLRQTNVPAVIDYLSLDVEGAEYLVMKDFPWDHYVFRFVTIERANKKLRELLAAKGYLLARMISDFGESLWIHNTFLLSKKEIDDICVGLDIGSYSRVPSEWKLPRYSNYDDG